MVVHAYRKRNWFEVVMFNKDLEELKSKETMMNNTIHEI